VRYEPGELKVVAYDASGRAAAEKTVRTAGAPHHLDVEVDRMCLSAPSAHDTPDLAFVTVRVLDKDGTPCPTAAIRLNFAASGSVDFKAACNGDATSLESFVKPTMLTFNGELVALVEAKAVGEGYLSVSAKDMPPAEIKFTVTKP
jgi:beta-galactosidase